MAEASELSLAFVLGSLLSKILSTPTTWPLSVPGIKLVVIDLPVLRVRNRDAIHFQRAADGALVVRFRFDEVRQCAEFVALRADQVALRQDDVVNRRCAELIFLLLGVERLLLQFARFAGRLHLRSILRQRNERIAHIQHRCISSSAASVLRSAR